MRPLVPIVLVASALTLALVVFTGGDGDAHRVRILTPRATGLAPGFAVRLNGRQVGAVESVDLRDDYKVGVELRLDDEVAWPLPRDTRFVTRMGGTIKFGDRYVEIKRGRSATPIRDGEMLSARSFVDPVEFDAVFNLFSPQTRGDLKRTLLTAAPAATGVAQHLPAALTHGPRAAVAVESITGQLKDDPVALDRLVRSTAGVATSIAAADPGLGDLVANAATTFSSVAREAQGVKVTLDELPTTLAAVRRTATTADTTFVLAGDVTRRIKPGVARLRAVSAPLARLLGTVRDVAPPATSALATVRRAAPDLNVLLERVRTPLLGQVESIGREAAKQLSCIRPYAPEIAGLAVNWGGFFGKGDQRSKVARAQAGVVPYPNETPFDSGTLAKLLGPSLKMAFPRPPGELVGQPWFQPHCGITEDALDPAKDPEANAGDPTTSKQLIDIDNRRPGG